MPAILAISPRAPIGAREIDILRALGRLGPMNVMDLYELVVPGVPQRTRQRLMQRLLNQGAVWKTMIGHPTRGRLVVYGLTMDGRLQLETHQIEPDQMTYECLIARDRRGGLPADHQLRSDLAISSWCASLLAELRKLPLLESQRNQSPTFSRIFALVIDDGKAAVRTIEAQARCSCELFVRGRYAELFGGMSLFWPQTPAMIATENQVNHEAYGVIGGQYRAVTRMNDPALFLLRPPLKDIEQWGKLTAAWRPDCTD